MRLAGRCIALRSMIGTAPLKPKEGLNGAPSRASTVTVAAAADACSKEFLQGAASRWGLGTDWAGRKSPAVPRESGRRLDRRSASLLRERSKTLLRRYWCP